ncbi:MAG: phage head closure protein, partial [Porcipelethomonas sp.]
TFGGTEKIIDNILAGENTAVIETRYRSDINPDCIIKTEDGVSYEIIGSPENISMRNQYLKFKVRCIKGGA